MKDRSWIIILIMGIALAISLGYSIWISNKTSSTGESTVTTTSIIEMTATTVTIKNTLTGTGNVEYKEKPQEENQNTENTENIQSQENNQIENKDNVEAEQNIEKIYQVILTIEDKDLEKAKINQEVEISIKKDGETLNYLGEVIEINKNTNNKSTLNIQITNPDDKIEENLLAVCTVIVEKAENVVALPIEAIQKNEQNQDFVDVVQVDGTTKSVIIKTGISDDYYVEITEGLNVGDRVQIIKSSTTVVKDKDENKTSEN